MQIAERYETTNLWEDVIQKIEQELSITSPEVPTDATLAKTEERLELIKKFWNLRRRVILQDFQYKYLSRQKLTLDSRTTDENESNYWCRINYLPTWNVL